ncbi:MAG: cell division protein ZapA [Spirochaetes bacterium]|nr:cell division protein ZapA [Spirochaetota bacterium]
MSEVIKHIKVNILGNEYTLKTDADEYYIKQLADYLNKKFLEMTHKGHGPSTLKESIMVALNVADDFFRLKEQVEKTERDLKTRADELIKKIEDGLTKEYIEIK